jgi:hypothetical protein
LLFSLFNFFHCKIFLKILYGRSFGNYLKTHCHWYQSFTRTRNNKTQITMVKSRNNESAMVEGRKYDDYKSEVRSWKVEITKQRNHNGKRWKIPWWKHKIISSINHRGFVIPIRYYYICFLNIFYERFVNAIEHKE